MNNYTVRKIDKGIGYGFAVLLNGEIVETFLNLPDCAAFIGLHQAGMIDKEYNNILPKP